jgi:hypothetical protein
MLRLKYGPDRLVIGRRNLFRRLCAIIFENLAAFAFPFSLAVSFCLVFFPKKKKPPSDKPPSGLKKIWLAVKAKLDGGKGKVSPLIIMVLAPVALLLALSTAGSTLVRFWTEINKYYKYIDFPDSHCNFVVTADFISNEKGMEALALAAFTLWDFILTISVVAWCCLVCLAACCFQTCCNFRLYLCCVPCKYCSCHCCCCMLLANLCGVCAALVFVVALLPLIIYFLAVGLAACIMYGLILVLLVAVFLCGTFILRNVLAVLTAFLLIEPTRPGAFLEQSFQVIKREVDYIKQSMHGPKEQDLENVKGDCQRAQKFSLWMQWTSKLTLLSFLVPFFFMLMALIIPSSVDSGMMMYAMNHMDMKWFYDKYDDPLQIWGKLFDVTWMEYAEGITDFAHDAFVDWPAMILDNIAGKSEGGSSGFGVVKDNFESTRVWAENDWQDYKKGVMVARAWLSALDGVIISIMAIKYALTQDKEGFDDTPAYVGNPSKVAPMGGGLSLPGIAQGIGQRMQK